MKKPNAFFIILFLLIGSMVISWPLYFKNYAAPDTVDIHRFPMVIGEWTAEELPISDSDYAILETRNAFTRVYTHNTTGAQIILFIIYSQHNRRVAHPPEICYSGGGMTITKKYTYAVPVDETTSLNVSKMTIDEERYQQIMYYWFKIGETYTPNYLRQQIMIALKTLLGQPSSSAMIRITSVIQNDDPETTTRHMNTFVQALLPVLPEYLLER